MQGELPFESDDAHDAAEELPPGWALASLGELIPSPRSKVPPDPDSTLPFVGMDHIEPDSFEVTGQDEFRNMKSAGSAFSEGDVLYGRLRPYLNKVHKARFEGVASAEFIVLPAADTHDSDFLKYLLHQMTFVQFANEQSSGDRPRVKFDAISGFQFPLPPLPEQRRIVDRIDELFSRIEAGERAVEAARAALKRYRKAVLKAAVTGSLTEDWRATHEPEETAEDLLARILKERRAAWEKAELGKLKAKGKPAPSTDKQWEKFRDRYKAPVEPDPDGLPDLPAGWVWATPVQLEADTKNALTIGPFGSNLKVSDYTETGVPLIFVRHIRTQNFDGETPKFVMPSKAAELSSHSASGGDVLITKMGDPPGDACVYPRGRPDAIITADCIKWTINGSVSSPEYCALVINSAIGAAQIAEITTGVAQQKVSLDRFRKICIPLPPLAEQTEIVSRVEEALSRADAAEATLEAQTRAARALKQSILKAAFTGHLVPQNPDDEPASELLERVKGADK